MLLCVIADDYTKASYCSNTLIKGHGRPGLATAEFIGVLAGDADPACEAGVVALKSRSLSATEAVAQSLGALDWLRRQGCRQFVFKHCSTFDSTAAGNIGPVGETQAAALGAKGVVACPAYPTAGRTRYQGQLLLGYVPLSASNLTNNPSTL